MERFVVERCVVERVELEWLVVERVVVERVELEWLVVEWLVVERVVVERVELEWLVVERVELERLVLERYSVDLAAPGGRPIPWQGRLVIGLAAVSGAATGASAIHASSRHGIGPISTVLVLAACVTASWLWPLILFRGGESEAVHLDEGFFVIMVLLLPTAGVLLAFALAAATAQLVRRRPAIKSVFNLGQILTAVGLGLLIAHAAGAPNGRVNAAQLACAAAGALVFFIVNSAFLAAILAATGAVPFRRVVVDGLEIRFLLLGACLGLGAVTALAVSAYAWALALVGVPFVILRQVLAGHFRARHDRARLDGLFAATLSAHHSIGGREVETALCQSAKQLLRCPVAILSSSPPGSHQLAGSVVVNGTERWLKVSGRNKGEPFDSADVALLDALAAIGAGALTNASLYEDGRRQRERLAAMTSSLGEGVCAMDLNGTVVFSNPAAEDMLGWTEVELAALTAIGGNSRALDFLSGPAARAVETSDTTRVDDVTFRRWDGSPFPVAFTCSPVLDAGVVSGAVITFRAISERKSLEERLTHHAFHDELTGLPNRRLFLDRLEHALGRNHRREETRAVLFIDVDRFKAINDSAGHQAGDRLLAGIAERLAGALRPGDTLARFGGDEFTVLLEDVADVGDAEAAAGRMLDVLRDPIAIGNGKEVVVTISIGISVATGAATADDLLHNADVAMYQAKTRGVGSYKVFDVKAMGARSVDRLDLEACLRRALDNEDEIDVYYQPVVSSETGDIVGAEALVRWRHPTRGLLAPGHFIPLAEETGLILPLGRLVLNQACLVASGISDQIGFPLSMSVNLSGRQFGHPNVVAEVADAIRRSRMDPAHLCLEITESVAVEDLQRSDGIMGDLKAVGVRLAIDDFGTGYSSLKYLKRFPVDIVKIDRSFVVGVDVSPVDAAIVEAVLGLATAIGMTTIAEGVETFGQLRRLREMGCPLVQGFYIGRPMPAAAFIDAVVVNVDPRVAPDLVGRAS